MDVDVMILRVIWKNESLRVLVLIRHCGGKGKPGLDAKITVRKPRAEHTAGLES